MPNDLAWIALATIAGYLLGSIPPGLIASRARGLDLRDHGSGSSGATNAMRVLGWQAAVLVVLSDALKGIVAVLLATWLVPLETYGADAAATAQAAATLAVVFGHNWPVFAEFRGGRGVATSFGAILAISPTAAMACIGVFLVTLLIWRYVSLASIGAAVTTMVIFPLLAASGDLGWQFSVMAYIGGPIIILRHAGNIQRLRTGNERKVFN